MTIKYHINAKAHKKSKKPQLHVLASLQGQFRRIRHLLASCFEAGTQSRDVDKSLDDVARWQHVKGDVA